MLSSHLYHSFDQILVLAQGRALYSGAGGFAPAEHFSAQGIAYKDGYNVADYLLEIASEPPVAAFDLSGNSKTGLHGGPAAASTDEVEKGFVGTSPTGIELESKVEAQEPKKKSWFHTSHYQATFLTQLEVLSGREWKILRRDKTLFFAHIAIACVLGVFCGKPLDTFSSATLMRNPSRWAILPHRSHYRRLPVPRGVPLLPGELNPGSPSDVFRSRSRSPGCPHCFLVSQCAIQCRRD